MDIINKIFLTKNCGELVVLQQERKQNNRWLYKCKFIKTGTIVFALKGNILAGSIIDFMIPSIYNKGYLGIGKYNRKDYEQIYNKWISILNRCYCKKSNHYNSYGNLNVTVCENWLNFQNFAKWYEKHYVEGYELDKDVLSNIQHLEQKVYSPETCLFIPGELNTFLTGDCLKCGIRNITNYSFQVRINSLKKSFYLGTFNTFKEAKLAYAKKKYEFWLEEINKFELLEDLKEILLQYDFSWSWLLI